MHLSEGDITDIMFTLLPTVDISIISKRKTPNKNKLRAEYGDRNKWENLKFGEMKKLKIPSMNRYMKGEKGPTGRGTW